MFLALEMGKIKKTEIMKKLIVSICISVFTLGVYAQEKEKQERTPEERIEMRLERMKTELSLTKEQESTIREAMIVRSNEVKKIREAHIGDREAMRKALHPVRMTFHRTMKETLSDEQFKKWQEMNLSRKNHPPKNAKGETRKELKRSRDSRENK